MFYLIVFCVFMKMCVNELKPIIFTFYWMLDMIRKMQKKADLNLELKRGRTSQNSEGNRAAATRLAVSGARVVSQHTTHVANTGLSRMAVREHQFTQHGHLMAVLPSMTRAV